MPKKEEKEEPKEKKERFVIGEVPTQTAPAIIDTKTQDVYTIEQAIKKILNDLEELKGLLW